VGERNPYATDELRAGWLILDLLTDADKARVRADVERDEKRGRTVVEVTLDAFGVTAARYLRPAPVGKEG
jgi:hypothetical protein